MYVLYACLRDNVKIVTGSVQIVLTARAVTVKKQLKQNKKKPRYWATNCERSQCHSCAYLKIKLSWYRIGLDPRLLNKTEYLMLHIGTGSVMLIISGQTK